MATTRRNTFLFTPSPYMEAYVVTLELNGQIKTECFIHREEMCFIQRCNDLSSAGVLYLEFILYFECPL